MIIEYGIWIRKYFWRIRQRKKPSVEDFRRSRRTEI